MKSVMQHSFAEVTSAKVPRSSFNRSHGLKTTFDAGYLIPIFVDEVIPGDTFNLRMSHFARLATPLTPIMDNMYLDSFFFFIPTRLVWDNFKKFHGEEVDPGDSNDYAIPTMDAPTGGHLNGSLSDYLGIPTEHHASNTLTHSSLLHRCYNLIWNEWFRDQNLQDSVVVDKDDGPDTTTDYVLLQRGKRHDYFTSGLPWPQKSDDGAVDLPLGTTAPIVFDQYSGSTAADGNYVVVSGDGTDDPNMYYSSTYGSGSGSTIPTSTSQNMAADLSLATAATIDDLILSFQTQALYRRDARAGTRYPELVLSHYGVKPYDLLFRPLYLGGGSSPVQIQPVANTSADGTSVQGELTGFGTSHGSGHGFIQSFSEHGYILGLVSARADLTYQEGLDRMFSKSDRFDFYYPALANLGEQATLNKEIFADGSANDDGVFNYQERWSEYRFKQSKITGQFRSNYSSSLDSWHLSQEFGTLPTFNASFIVDAPPIDRCIATPTEPHFIFDAYFDLVCARPLPVYSVPSLKQYF
jgi:hypothetical protein